MFTVSKPTLMVTCSMRDNKFWKNSQPLRKEWSKKIGDERNRRIDNVKDTFSFITDIARQDVEIFKSLHMDAFESIRKNKSSDSASTVFYHEVTPVMNSDDNTSRSDIFDKDL